jgi:hypothetical protein
MSENPYSVGDRVLASRAQDGENHEEATVTDSHSLIIGPETRPIVIVQFDDGEKGYFTAAPPDVLPLPEPEESPEAADGAEGPPS